MKKKLDSTQKKDMLIYLKKDYVEPASEQVIIEEEKNWFEKKVVELLTEKNILENYYILSI